MNRFFGAVRTGTVVASLSAAVVAVVFFVVIPRAHRTGEDGSGLGREFTYDIGDLRKTDPKLILCEQTGAIATGFVEARCVAVGADDRVYAAGDKAIRIFDRDGQRLSEIKLAAPAGALAVEGGTLYVCMTDHVEVYDAAGNLQAKWDGLGKEAVLTSVAASKTDVFAADAGNRVVLRYNPSGKLLGRIGQRDEARDIPGFVVPSPYFDLAIGPEGLLWVTNPGHRRMEAYTFEGDRELWWGSSSAAIEGFSGCCNPTSFACLPDGKIVTCEKGLTRVKVYDYRGHFEGVVAGPEQFAEGGRACTAGGGAECTSRALDVAVDSRGRALVLDPLVRQIRIFTRIQKPPRGGGK